MRLRTISGWAFALATLLLVGPAAGRKPAPVGSEANATPATVRAGLQLPVQKAKLDNGLRVVMTVNRSAPTLAVCMAYDAGLRDEGPAEQGFVHLLEEILRQAGGQPALVQARGGTAFSQVGHDRTTFCSDVPAGELDLAVWLEARRIGVGVPSAPEVQRAGATAAARLRREGSRLEHVGQYRLSGLMFLGARQQLPDPGAAVEEIEGTERRRVHQFFRDTFRLDRAVLVISGDFDPDAAMRVVRREWGGVKPARSARAAPARTDVRQQSERFLALDQDLTQAPVLHVGWVIPAVRTPAHRALTLAAMLLGGDAGSLLHRELVVRTKLARSVSAWTGGDRDATELVVRVELTRTATIKKVERAIRDQLRRLVYAGPTQAALDAARNRWLTALVLRTQTNLERAQLLGETELIAGDARLLAREVDTFEAITRGQVRDAVKAYLGDTQRSAVAAYPPGWRVPAGGPLQHFHLVHPGESLIAIAKHYQVSLKDLLAANELDAKKPIYPGQKLRLPAGAKVPKQKPGANRKPAPRGRSKKAEPAARGKPAKPAATSKPTQATSRRARPEAKAPPRRTASQAKAKPQAPTQRVHVVSKNQTLLGIARRYGVTLTQLCRANGITSKQPIRPGQRLVIPAQQ